ncbi:MAG: hypothetical protein EBR09_12165 [Proteobacteria bacterium]|nr:hypothetical protein [Pseudomonadota bacterium]
MLFRLISAFTALTIAAAFLGWVKSHSPDGHDGRRIDEFFSVQGGPPASGKKVRTNRLQVADSAR